MISRDVQFVKNEAWDGSIERIIKILDNIIHNDIEYEVVQIPITSQGTIPSTSRIVIQIVAKTTLVRFAGAHSTPRVKQNPASSQSNSTFPYLMLESLLPRNTRSMCNIYNVDTTNSFPFFLCFHK